jgi:hypothetical protein
MALVTRILLHKHSKPETGDINVTHSKNEHDGQLLHISSSWRRLFTSKPDHVKGRWVPTLTGMIKAGDEGLFPSALFANLHGSGELSLQTLYEVFAEELRSGPMTERSAYSKEISRFLSSTKRPTNGPKRVQSMSHRATNKSRIDGPSRTQRMSLDLSAAEKGFARSMSVMKPKPTLVSMRNGLSDVDKGKDIQTSWMKDGQIAESRYGSIAVKITPVELAALSVILGSPLTVSGREDYAPIKKGAFNVSISSSVTEDGKYQITLRQHKRITSHMPARGSGISPLFAKHLAAGSLPYLQDKRTIHSILVNSQTLRNVQASSSIYLHESNFKTSQSRFLTSLPSSYELSFHIAGASTKPVLTNPLIDAVGALPFVGGLVPLASVPLIETVQFVASGGFSTAKLLQRLEALVDKVNRHAPHLNTFGPLYERHNAALLYRERERLGKLGTDVSTTDSSADKASRMQRYITLLERLMALIPDMKPQDVIAAVEDATKKELKRSTIDAVAAHQADLSKKSPVTNPCGFSKQGSQSKRFSTHSYSNRSSDASMSNTVSPSSSSSSSMQNNLGEQIEQILKKELPLSVENVAIVARMVIVAWTLSVEKVAWAEGEEGFKVPDLSKFPEKMVLC